MKTSYEVTFIVEMLFYQNKSNFSLKVSDVEKIFDVELEKGDKDYVELHCLLRLCGVEFLYMKKSNTCGFMRLYDINKWTIADISMLPQRETPDKIPAIDWDDTLLHC